MSVLLGVVKDCAKQVLESDLCAWAAPTRRYATSDAPIVIDGRVGMVIQHYRSHARSSLDSHPIVDSSGNLISFDGRLDNFREIAKLLGINHPDISDSEIVLSAFGRWGESSFSHLTGDWAFALWSARDEKLFLARDHAGTRSLYFTHSKNEIRWGTYLESLLAGEQGIHVSRDYAAAFLTCSPVRDLTPYHNVRAVKPGHYVTFNDGPLQRSHWNPLVLNSILYKDETEYDAHFLSVFGAAVARRTGPGEPVIAQLSGGVDSTSIVCMSDNLRRRDDPGAEILDTLSYFDDSEGSLDEKRHFMITEQIRGKTGTHLEIVSSQRSFELPKGDGVYLLPGSDNFSLQLERALYKIVWENGYRSILSGVGGDEVLGGVPSGLPELADYLVSARLPRLLQRSMAWSLPDRKPLIGTLCETARYTARLYFQSNPKSRPTPPWLSRSLRELFRELERGVEIVPRRLGIQPHRIENAITWWHIMESLPHLSPQILFRPEYRYPMLDKDLVEYLFAIPPDQLVRPGRRRAMMRRSLKGIVPVEILERKRKAFQLRASMSAIRGAEANLKQLMSASIAAEMGLIDVGAFSKMLKATIDGNAQWYQAILRTIAYELWLRMWAARHTLAEEHRSPPSLAAV